MDFWGTVESAVLESPLFGANISTRSIVDAELWPIFCSKYPNFRYHGNKGRFGIHLNITVRSGGSKILFGENSLRDRLPLWSYDNLKFPYWLQMFSFGSLCPLKVSQGQNAYGQ